MLSGNEESKNFFFNIIHTLTKLLKHSLAMRKIWQISVSALFTFQCRLSDESYKLSSVSASAGSYRHWSHPMSFDACPSSRHIVRPACDWCSESVADGSRTCICKNCLHENGVAAAGIVGESDCDVHECSGYYASICCRHSCAHTPHSKKFISWLVSTLFDHCGTTSWSVINYLINWQRSWLFIIIEICLHSCTDTHPFNGLLSRTTRVSRYQKGKTNLDFTEARDSEWQWHQLGGMQVCTSLQSDNHAGTPPLIFLQAGCPSCCPTSSVKALKAHCLLSCSVIEIVKISCIKIFHVLVAISKAMWQ